MSSSGRKLSDEEARAVWRRAAELQARAEFRAEQAARQLPAEAGLPATETDGLDAADISAAGEEAGISPEFIQIALAETNASGTAAAMAPHDLVGSRIFLGASRYTLEVAKTVPGTVETLSRAVLQVFTGHPCLLQPGDIADLPSGAGRVLVFRVPRYDWGATANPPFVEKASTIGLKQLHVAIRPVSSEPPACDIVVSGDLHPGMRNRWRWSAATAAGAGVAGGAGGVGLAGAAIAGALLAVPAALGAVAAGGVTVGAWIATYRYYRRAVEESLEEAMEMLPAAVRGIVLTRDDS